MICAPPSSEALRLHSTEVPGLPKTTHLAIDPELLERAVAVSGERTKTDALKRALEEFIARREQGAIVDLFGTLEWDPEYDYKEARITSGASRPKFVRSGAAPSFSCSDRPTV